MICYINKQNFPCVTSVVLAIKYKGWRTLVCYYDPFEKRVKIEKFWQPSNNYIKRGFYVIGEDEVFTSSRGWNGYDWVLNEIPRLFPRAKKFSSAINDKARALFEKHNVKEWYDINDQKSIKAFTEASMYLHDSSIERISEEDGKTQIIFDTSWGNYILLEAEGCTIEGVESGEEYNDTNVEIKEGKIHITIDKMFCGDEDDYCAKIIASKISWKMIISEQKEYRREESEDLK